MWNRRGFSKYLSAAAERETESVFFVFRFTAAPFNCGHVLLQSKCTAQPVEDLRVSAVPRTGLPLSPGGVSKGEGRCRPFVPRGGMGDGGVPHVSLSGVGGDILFSKENIPLTSCAASRHFLQQTAVFSAPFQFYPYNIYVIIQKVFNFGVSYERDQGKIFHR